jgi:hypothetical protein
MKVKDFDYKKDNHTKNYSVLVLHEDREYVKGISLKNLSKEEYEELITLQSDYERALKKFMSNYKQFRKDNILLD